MTESHAEAVWVVTKGTYGGTRRVAAVFGNEESAKEYVEPRRGQHDFYQVSMWPLWHGAPNDTKD